MTTQKRTLEIKEDLRFFKENWFLVIRYALAKGFIYSIQAGIICAVVKYIWVKK